MKIIELLKVQFRYPDSGFSLEDISLSLSTQQILAIWGENGSGKTTLLRLIAGTLKPQNGECVLFEIPRISLVPAELHHFLLPWYTVAKNFSFFYSRGESTSLKYIAEIREYLSEFSCSLPFSINELESRKVWELSTGQLGIIALACALLTKPSLLLLDEIFANLSIKVIQSISVFLKSIANDRVGIAFTTHNPQVIKLLSSHVFEISTNTKSLVTEHEVVN